MRGRTVFAAGLSLIALIQVHSSANAEPIGIEPSKCVYRQGDDPSWAGSNIDESEWQATQVSTQLNAIEDSPYSWRRCHIELPPNLVDPYIQLGLDSAWQLFADGELIGSFGDMQSGQFSLDVAQFRRIPVDVAKKGSFVIAVRQLNRSLAMIRYRPTIPDVSAGSLAILRAQTAEACFDAWRSRSFQFACYGIIGAAGLFLLILAGVDRQHSDTLWMAAACLVLALLRLNELGQILLVPYPAFIGTMIFALGQSVAALQIFFFFSLTERRVPTFWKTVAALTLLGPILYLFSAFAPPRGSQILALVGGNEGLESTFRLTILMVARIGFFAAFWPITKIPEHLRAFFAAGLLWFSGDIVNYLFQFMWMSSYDVTGIPRTYRAVATTPAIVAMFFLLVKRMRTVAEERSELQTEMRAAQEAQQSLIPSSLDVEPWLHIEVSYRPAKLVGGDFYFCKRSPAGQWIVIGDVSGKGLKAAMTAASVLGALRISDFSMAPSQLLEVLNKAVLSANPSGFVTCCALLIDKSGFVHLSTAGHLQPWLDSKEIETEGGLPLGISPSISWGETSFPIRVGQRVTLISDGVVEARSTAGELFGFDRVSELLKCGADATGLASAAEQFGQEDDITALTVKSLS